MGSKGITLLELLVAMSVLSILAAVGLTTTLNSDTMKAPLESERVKDTRIMARNIARNRIKCVEVQVNAHSIELTPYDSCSPLPAGPGVTGVVEFETFITLAPFDLGNPLLFNAQGGIQGAAGPATMIVTSSSGRVFKYTIMPAIGTVSQR